MTSVNNFLEKATRIAVGILMIVLSTNVLMQILSRQILRVSMVWTDEVARFSFIWMTMLGASLQVRHKSHYAVTMISEQFKNRKFFNYLVFLSILVVAGMLLYFGYRYALMGLRRVSPSTNIKMIWIYSAIPVGGLLMIFYSLEGVLIEAGILKKINKEDEGKEAVL